jgi:nucleotide-binding universal stress UspA family protein
MYKNILLAIDGSPTSELALHEALKFAEIGCAIIAVSVIDNPLVNYDYASPYTTATFDYASIHTAFCQQAETILKNAESEARRISNVAIQTFIIDMGIHLDHNGIAGALEKAAIEYHADLIIIGTHGRRGIKRLFMGSVAEEVIRRSRLPVLIIRDPQETQE